MQILFLHTEVWSQIPRPLDLQLCWSPGPLNSVSTSSPEMYPTVCSLTPPILISSYSLCAGALVPHEDMPCPVCKTSVIHFPVSGCLWLMMNLAIILQVQIQSHSLCLIWHLLYFFNYEIKAVPSEDQVEVIKNCENLLKNHKEKKANTENAAVWKQNW